MSPDFQSTTFSSSTATSAFSSSWKAPVALSLTKWTCFPAGSGHIPIPFYLGRRRVWLSLRTLPLRGWHAQQLRRIAIADKIAEEALFYCDSDVAFLKPFDCASLWRGTDLRLFRRDNELLGERPGDQKLWADNAALLLGIKDAPVLPHGYVGTLIAWRRDRLARHVPPH